MPALIAARFAAGMVHKYLQEVRTREKTMKIRFASVFVDDQEKALRFYTDVLGFVKKSDMPVGDFRWLTVVSPDGPAEIELLLEPNDNPAAKTYQEAIFAQDIAATAFVVGNIEREHERLAGLGVHFRIPPTETQGPTIAMFEDTCGNLIQLVQE